MEKRKEWKKWFSNVAKRIYFLSTFWKCLVLCSRFLHCYRQVDYSSLLYDLENKNGYLYQTSRYKFPRGIKLTNFWNKFLRMINSVKKRKLLFLSILCELTFHLLICIIESYCSGFWLDWINFVLLFAGNSKILLKKNKIHIPLNCARIIFANGVVREKLTGYVFANFPKILIFGIYFRENRQNSRKFVLQ